MLYRPARAQAGGINTLESIPGLHKSFKNTVSVRFTSLVFFASILPISGIRQVRSALIFRICGIKRLRFDLYNLCNKHSLLRFIFRICGINRTNFASIFLRCRISRVRFTLIFTSSGISWFVSIRYRKQSQDQSFVPPSFRYRCHYYSPPVSINDTGSKFATTADSSWGRMGGILLPLSFFTS